MSPGFYRYMEAYCSGSDAFEYAYACVHIVSGREIGQSGRRMTAIKVVSRKSELSSLSVL